MTDLVPQGPAGEFLLYQAEDGLTQVQVRVEADTVWLSQRAMAEADKSSGTGMSMDSPSGATMTRSSMRTYSCNAPSKL